MKKIVSVLFLFSLMLWGSAKADEPMKFEQAISQTKPMALLVYADWADDAQTVLQTFNATGLQYEGKYNFVTMNIASPDTKAFNKSYHIYPNLPYVLFFKDKGKVSRYLKKDCVLNASCFKEKLDFFIN